MTTAAGTSDGTEGCDNVSVPVAGANEGQSLTIQQKVRAVYNSNGVQVLVAGIIVANFATNIVEKQVDPTGAIYSAPPGWGVFEVLDFIYNVLFLVELMVNFYAHFFWTFWSAWNVFDVVVVTIGVINMMELPLPKAFSLLRMMRAFRVFRLFKRVKSLNRIIVAIVHAVPGVMNAFLILAIVMSIYAILAVEFYHVI